MTHPLDVPDEPYERMREEADEANIREEAKHVAERGDKRIQERR